MISKRLGVGFVIVKLLLAAKYADHHKKAGGRKYISATSLKFLTLINANYEPKSQFSLKII
jgi:hypothetical protein